MDERIKEKSAILCSVRVLQGQLGRQYNLFAAFEVNSSKTSDWCLIVRGLVTESYEKHAVNFYEVNHREKE